LNLDFLDWFDFLIFLIEELLRFDMQDMRNAK